MIFNEVAEPVLAPKGQGRAPQPVSPRAHRHHQARRRIAAISLAACLALAAALTSTILQYSFREGRLVVFPTFDDVGYFADSAGRFKAFQDGGLPALVREYLVSPPHSPTETFLCVLSYVLFGLRDWSPYVLNGFVALGFFLLVKRLLRGAGWPQQIITLCFAATLPFVGMAIHEFRPDPIVALLTAAGTLLLFTGPFVYGSRGRKLLAGTWLGLAMLTKPPVFPQTVTLAFFAMFLATVGDWLSAGRRPRVGAIIRAWVTVLLPFILIPLPHYAYDRNHILGYIYDILFGRFRETYAIVKGSAVQQLLYYLTGDGGDLMLGRHLLLLFVLLGIALAGILLTLGRASRWRAMMLLPLVGLAYLIPTSLHTKQPFFGLGFDFLLAGAGLLMLGRLLAAEHLSRRRRLPWASATICILLALGLWRFQWPTRCGDRNAGWEVQRRQIVDSIFDTIVAHCTFANLDTAPLPDPSVPADRKVDARIPSVLFLHLGDMNSALLRYMAIQRQIPMEGFFNGDGIAVEDHLPYIDDADFVICSDFGTLLMADFMPTGKIADQLTAIMRARPDFIEIARWSFIKSDHKNIYLFMRHETPATAAFFGFSDVSGLGPVEGPIPKEHIRVVRWGMGPSTTLSIHADEPSDRLLHWTGRTDFQQQFVTVSLNGKDIAREAIPGSFTDFYPTEIPLHLAAGDNTLVLKYARWHQEKEVDRPLGVLFKRLRIDLPPPAPASAQPASASTQPAKD